MFDANLKTELASLPESRRRELRSAQPLPLGRILVEGKELIDFSSNDYLGLRCKDFNIGHQPAACSSRLLVGNHPLHELVESRLGKLKGAAAALIFGTGFQLNATVLGSLLSKTFHGSDSRNRSAIHVFVDRLVHGSMHDGLARAEVKQIRYRHNDLGDLEQRLKQDVEQSGPEFPRIVVTESVFSMDGDITDVPHLRQLASRFGAALYIDEAHAVGVLGEKGLGLMAPTLEHPHLKDEEMVVGTFSKAFTSFGAYIACSATVRQALINFCPGLIYSTGLPPNELQRIQSVLELIPSLESERKHLQDLAGGLTAELKRLGLLLSQNSATRVSGREQSSLFSPIVPVFVGDDARCLSHAEALKEQGVLVSAVRPPTVPEGTARLRVSLSAAHTHDDVKRLVETLSALSNR